MYTEAKNMYLCNYHRSHIFYTRHYPDATPYSLREHTCSTKNILTTATPDTIISASPPTCPWRQYISPFNATTYDPWRQCHPVGAVHIPLRAETTLPSVQFKHWRRRGGVFCRKLSGQKLIFKSSCWWYFKT